MALFLRFLIFLFVLAILLRVGVLFSVAWFLLALVVVSYSWVKRSLGQIATSRRFTDHAFCGTEVPVELKVQNLSRLPVPWLQLSEPVTAGLRNSGVEYALSLGPRQRRSFAYTVSCRERGYFPIGPASIETGDVFGIETRTRDVGEADHLTVYPRIVPLARLGLPTRSPLADVVSKTPLFEDTSRVIGVRDYRSGDPLRNIHWTSTAKTGRLVVKQYQTATSRESLIFLDLSWKGYPVRRHLASEQAIMVAASLANHVSEVEGLPVGISLEAVDATVGKTNRVSIPPRAGKAQLITILELLAKVQISPDSHFGAVLQEGSANLPSGSTLLVVTGEMTHELATTVLRLKRGGHAVALILVGPNHAQVQREQPSLPGIRVHYVRADADLAALA